MPGIYRRTDNCTGHGCWPPRPPATWSPNVFVNNLNVIRFTDQMMIHCCPPPCHGGTLMGRHNVYANDLDIQVCGDPISCGSSVGECSPDVIVN